MDRKSGRAWREWPFAGDSVGSMGRKLTRHESKSVRNLL